jgi:hypothetical protein
MLSCKPAKTPFWLSDISVPPANIEIKPLNKQEHEQYRSIVGSLLYAANITRIDIAYIVNVLGRYNNKPYNYHLTAAKHVLRYLRGTMDKKLIFGPLINPTTNGPFDLCIYTDSNWANEKSDRKSTGGFIVLMNGRPVSWQSKKQSTVANSSTEAEYYALTDAVKEALFIRQWFQVYCNTIVPIKILCDNQGSIHWADHTTDHNRTKHIDIKHFFVREHVKNKTVIVEYVDTTNQLADILTKATGVQIFQRIRETLLK